MQLVPLSSPSLRRPSRLLRAAPDERLVAALRRGEESAFEAIYDRHHRALLGFCRHMLGSHEEAEDALQHVFVSAHRHLREGSAGVNLKPWLFTIARNRCLSMLRARHEMLALDDADEPSGAGLAVADEVELREDLKAMLCDVARLPVDQRAALVLAELGDVSQREIAAILDVPPGKVKALIFQAREALAGWRQARAASCEEIREQLATLQGSALRRSPIRRHVAVCPTCAAFESEVKRQRAALALVLPVVPSATLKHSVLSATVSGGHAAAAAGAVASGASGLTAKALAVAAIAACGGGGAVAVHELEQPRSAHGPAVVTLARTPDHAAAASVGARAREIPAAAQPRAARSPSRHGKAGHARHHGAARRTRRRDAHGRRPGRSGARSAPGRQRVAARGAPGRQRAPARRARPRVAQPAPRPTPVTPTSPAAAGKTPLPAPGLTTPVAPRGSSAPPFSARGKPLAASDRGA